MKSKQIIKWRGRAIEVEFDPNWLEGYEETYGYALCHLEIRSVDRRPLPITETGYVSKFERADNVMVEGGPVEYALAWLDHAAAQSATVTEVDPRQMSLL